MKTNKSIFIIERDPMYSFFLMKMLQDKIIYRTLEYMSFEEAVNDLIAVKPKYVIIEDDPDKGIDAMPGLVMLKTISPKTKAIILSAEKTFDKAVDLIRSGADHFVPKNKDVIQKLISTIH